MPRRNFELDSVMRKSVDSHEFAPEQVERIRRALVVDANLASALDRAANSGFFRGFAKGSVGARGRQIGHYDRESGIIALPQTVFADGGERDLSAVLRIQAMMVDLSTKSFADGSGVGRLVSQDMLDNLQDTINRSPVLVSEISRAVTTSDPADSKHRVLESFNLVGLGSGVGGSFDTSARAMNFVPGSLMSQPLFGSSVKYNAHDLTFVIGHEIQHGFNAKRVREERAAFVRGVREIAESRDLIHDYTSLLEQRIQSARNDEAIAEIAGWNALISRIGSDGDEVTLAHVFKVSKGRALDFVERRQGDTFVLRDNLKLDSDMTLPVTFENIEAMGYNYFDRPVEPGPGDTRQAMRLGAGGGSDYRNYYAGWAVATIAHEESKVHRRGSRPEIQIDMRHAGLDEGIMERAGLDLRPSESMPYLDSSMQPAVRHRFDHTADGPNRFKHVPISGESEVFDSSSRELPHDEDVSGTSSAGGTNGTLSTGALMRKHDAPAGGFAVPLGVAPRSFGSGRPSVGGLGDSHNGDFSRASGARPSPRHALHDTPGLPANFPIFDAAEHHRLFLEAMNRHREEQAEAVEHAREARDERRHENDRVIDERARADRARDQEERYWEGREASERERRYDDERFAAGPPDEHGLRGENEAARSAQSATHSPPFAHDDAWRHASHLEREYDGIESSPSADRSWDNTPPWQNAHTSGHDPLMHDARNAETSHDPSTIDDAWFMSLDTPRWDDTREAESIVFHRDTSDSHGRGRTYENPFPTPMHPVVGPPAPDPYANLDPADPFSYNPYLPGMPEEDKDMADMWLALQSNDTQAIDKAFDKLGERPEVQQLLQEAADIIERERVELAAQREAELAEQRRIDEMIRAQQEAESLQHGPRGKVLTLDLQPLTAADMGGAVGGGDGGGGGG
ncbi:hypothetical protein [Luteibacter sp. 3190]|uniref:hypothetical protein n=1 Tax=Luteibacter sp. 3190 TaxID=2817736 RepID=UPI00285F3DC6|nr:hypothetical protein [Luteibacter sp. 3190]MDR6936294.1 hypothetical protein [Luteibacter sp. 3190]